MRVAFGVIGGRHWTGGLNYLQNLLAALAELPRRPVAPVLFASPDLDSSIADRLRPFLAEQPRLSHLWSRRSSSYWFRLASAGLLQRDFRAERAFLSAGIDLVFQHSAWYGCRFGLPTLGWIADFQHRHLPRMFSRATYWKRDLGYRGLARCATGLLVSSEAAKRDCEFFYPISRGRINVLPFAVSVPAAVRNLDPVAARDRYGLPTRFFFLPNQFWKHKNHLAVVEAVRLLKARGARLVVALSGAPSDIRDPVYPKLVLSQIERLDLRGEIRVLGFVPHDDVLALMRAAVAVVNPSLFEGWSTTVEEAKALGVPLVLSDLPVHREQAPELCRFFNPNNPEETAGVLETAWRDWDAGPRPDLERAAAETASARFRQFAGLFATIAEKTASEFNAS